MGYVSFIFFFHIGLIDFKRCMLVNFFPSFWQELKGTAYKPGFHEINVRNNGSQVCRKLCFFQLRIGTQIQKLVEKAKIKKLKKPKQNKIKAAS